MKQFTIYLLFLVAFGFVLQSCQTVEAPEADASSPTLAASAAGYGSCTTCPLPASMTGPLSSHLYPGSAWNTALNNCYPEALPSSCQWKSGGTVSSSFSVYLQFAQNAANTVTGHCSYLYQAGNQIYAQRPSGNNWLLYSVDNFQHQSGSYFYVQVTWRKYICQWSPVKPVR